MNSEEFREHLYQALMATAAEAQPPPRERSIVGRVAVHLAPLIESRSPCIVDLDYRVADGDPKAGYWLKPDGIESHEIEVDLIVHRRGGSNHFCAEFKSGGPTAHPNILDQAKVLFLLGRASRHGHPLPIPPAAYQLGATINHRHVWGAEPTQGQHQWTVWWYETYRPCVNLIVTPPHRVPANDRDRKKALRELNGHRPQFWCAVDTWVHDGQGGIGGPPSGFPRIANLLPPR